jgi:hypothetical protein
MRVDVHQHLWPEQLFAALARRRQPPMLRRDGGRWMLRLDGEPEQPVDPADHDPDRRAALVRADDLDVALVAPSSPLGIESLAPDDAASLIGAYHDGAAQLPSELRAWATAGVAEPDPAALAAALDRGFVGACLPADALSGPEGFERCGPLLAVLEERGAPLFVHPGPARAAATAGRRMPPWWPALTDYVADMNAAWHAFAAFGRPNHPRLRVCFAMLAGLAPLHRERLEARGGRARVDPDAFLDTSSYGVRAVDSVLRALGVDVLVHGSDRPVIPAAELPLGEAVDTALRARNPARLLQEVLV